MTAINHHRILRQVLELDVASMAEAPSIQEAVAGQFRDQTLPELEALFDRLAGPDEILSLDRLEVDLGDLTGPGWQEQFHARLLGQIRHSLEQASRPATDSPPWEPSQSTGAHTTFRQWLFYLDRGRLPWWGGEPGPDWPETLCGELDPGQRKALSRLLRGDEKARLRLIHSAGDGVLGRLAETLGGLPEAARVLAVLTPVGLPDESTRHWRQQFWMTLLAGAHEIPPQIETGALLLRRLLEQRDAIARPNAGGYQGGPVPWGTKASHAGEKNIPPFPGIADDLKIGFQNHPLAERTPTVPTLAERSRSRESSPLFASTPLSERFKSTTLPLPEPWQLWLEAAVSQNANIGRQETGGPFHGEATAPASAEFPQPSTGTPEQAPPTDALPPEDADLPFQRLLFFLAHGRLPAWGGNAVDLSSAKPSPEEEGIRGLKSTAFTRDSEAETNWMDALGQQLHAGQWQLLAERLRGDYRARLRLVQCVGDGFLETLVETVAGLPEAARVSGLLSPADLSRESLVRWRQQFWMALLEWLAEDPVQPRNGERLLQRMLEQRAAVAALDPEINRDASYSPTLTHHHNFAGIRSPLEDDKANASSAKPSPEGQIRRERFWSRGERPQGSGLDSPETLGWVRGNNKEKSLFESPHPSPFDPAQGRLLPKGEGVHVLDSTTLPLPAPWLQWFEVAAQRSQAEEYGQDPSTTANFPPDIPSEPAFRPLPLQEGEAVYLRGAGAVILHPFIEELFRSRELLDDRAFRDEAARRRAVRLLGYLAFGTNDTPEYNLLLPKLLCGMAWEEPLPPAGLTREECECCDELLRAVLKHWSVLKSGSPEWLREQFFLRDGKLERLEENWKLTVERRIQDVLLDRLPWGIGLIRLPWMDGFLHVSWVQ